MPTLQGGYLTQVAEDGNPYPFPKQQYSVNLAAGKTIDALWQPAADGDHVLYDRRVTGMVATLNANTGSDTTPPVISLLGDNPVTVALNATYIDAGATASDNMDGDLTGSITLTSTVDTANAGSYSVTYSVMDAAGNTTTLSRTVNVVAMQPDITPPVITLNGTDPVEVTVGETYTDAGAMASDNVDGDLTDNITVTSNVNTATAGTYSVTYEVTDSAGNIAVPLTRTVNVVAQVNTAPVAVADTATVQRNSAATFINLTNNDTDADGNLKDSSGHVAPSQITITTGAVTTRNGSVTVLTNGVNYTPRNNFRGTDTFNYTVTDLDGAVSNEVTVRVNVVR
ncbi:MAG: DUF5011 domain-containing protein [Thiolinea sp.]